MTGTLGGGWAFAAPATVIIAALVCALLIVALYPWLRRYALAKPNARSSHRTPTPQGGGIAVIAATLATAVVAFAFFPLAPSAMPSLAVIGTAAVVMACIGAIDDVRPLPVGPRLLLQAIVIAGVLYALPEDLRVVPLLPWWLEFSVLGGLWFVNLVNFMDGIDWMTVAEVIPLTAALSVWALRARFRFTASCCRLRLAVPCSVSPISTGRSR